MGNKDYPYSDWKVKRIDFCLEFLQSTVNQYRQIKRDFRNLYKWDSNTVDNNFLYEIFRIHTEAEEDVENGSSRE